MSYMARIILIMIMLMSAFTGTIFGQISNREELMVKVGGAYIGAGIYIDQDNRPDTVAQRTNFDIAANVDINMTYGEHLEGALQLQAGAGGSSIGFVGSEDPATVVVLTDANLSYLFRQPDITLTVGSYDTPFGEETGYLTNNGDASANSFFLNSLFYSVLAGTQVGTLNTIGIMGNWHMEAVDATLSISNGTDEAADNPDGNFEICTRVGVSPISDFRIAGSYIYSDDKSESGGNGTESLFSGWLAEGRYDIAQKGFIKGYLGQVDYNDDDSQTEDEVLIWMVEGTLDASFLQFSARISGWTPSDDNGDGAGISPAIQNPGLAISFEPNEILMDQKIMRYQFGVTKRFFGHTDLKLEVVYDNYAEGLSDGSDANTLGILCGVNTTF